VLAVDFGHWSGSARVFWPSGLKIIVETHLVASVYMGSSSRSVVEADLNFGSPLFCVCQAGICLQELDAFFEKLRFPEGTGCAIAVIRWIYPTILSV